MTSIVFGGSGRVGGLIVSRLKGERIVAVSRKRRVSTPAVEWAIGDISEVDRIRLPDAETIYCTADVRLLAAALPKLIKPGLRRVVVFTTTSVVTKEDSGDAGERELMMEVRKAEQQIITTCEAHGVTWTILRPTMVYLEGRDRNITRLASIIWRWRVMPVVGRAQGLRQPVHAEDLAIAAVAAAKSPTAANRIYVLAGGETLTYREMIGRIFDGLGRRRIIIGLPACFWRLAFFLASPLLRGFNSEMGPRMQKDMTFDSTDAVKDLGWSPRGFHPHFKPAISR